MENFSDDIYIYEICYLQILQIHKYTAKIMCMTLVSWGVTSALKIFI